MMQLTAYLATAPKSAAVYKAMHSAFDAARKTGSLMPPKHILNAPTKLMKELGYNDGYVYDQDLEDGFPGKTIFPKKWGGGAFIIRWTEDLSGKLRKESIILIN